LIVAQRTDADWEPTLEQAIAQHRAGHYAEAAETAERALVLASRPLWPDRYRIARSENFLAIVRSGQADFTAAEGHYLRALGHFEAVNGPFHSNVALVQHNLADLYRERGEYAKAEPLLRRALPIFEANAAAWPDAVPMCLTSLGLLHVQQGRADEAVVELERALALRERSLSPNAPELAKSLNDLGLAYDRKMPEKALLLFERAVGIYERIGSSHPDLAVALVNLADTCRTLDMRERAESTYLRALDIQRRALGSRHPDVGVTLTGLARVTYELGKRDDALRMASESVAILEAALGPGHPHTAAAKRTLQAVKSG
jgi:tetratricopeptide (TPR) repeat protein